MKPTIENFAQCLFSITDYIKAQTTPESLHSVKTKFFSLTAEIGFESCVTTLIELGVVQTVRVKLGELEDTVIASPTVMAEFVKKYEEKITSV